MPDGPATDEGFAHLGDVDGALDPGFDALFLQGILEREGVDQRGQHAHVVAGGPLNAALAALQPAKDVAAPDDDHDLDTEIAHLLDLGAIWLRASALIP
jgi:hypothetical protein